MAISRASIPLGGAIAIAFNPTGTTQVARPGPAGAPRATGVAPHIPPLGTSGGQAYAQLEDGQARQEARVATQEVLQVKKQLEKTEKIINRVQTIAFTAFAVANSVRGIQGRPLSESITGATQALGFLGTEASKSLLSESGLLRRGAEAVGVGATNVTRIGGFLGRAAGLFAIATAVTEILGVDKAGADLRNATELASELGRTNPSALGYYYKNSGATLRDKLNKQVWLLGGAAYALANFLGANEAGQKLNEQIAKNRALLVGAFKSDPVFLAKMTGQDIHLAQWNSVLASRDPAQISDMANQIAARFELATDGKIGALVEDYKSHLQDASKYAENFGKHQRAVARHRRIRDLMGR